MKMHLSSTTFENDFWLYLQLAMLFDQTTTCTVVINLFIPNFTSENAYVDYYG